ncbi:pentatricopeptide repeat-containing protein At5g59600 [Andrographis paniculata]|uniref:pentatricopeptide repeat-containing protein At5g59600 n=1 Tax=Andrographis paniculata TaxID=175694 RepID=UPI0021E873D4|nr:pentatricopeptide repeat-containing protein At5g59600 [Andrographis paniculata]
MPAATLLPGRYVKLIQVYTRRGALIPGRVLHAHLIINGLACSAQVAAKLLAFYASCKELVCARKLFDEIPKSNIRGWVAVIGSYACNGYYGEAMGVFGEMHKLGMKCDRIILPSVLKACGQLCDLETGKKLHATAYRSGFQYDAFVMCALICMYSNCGMVGRARNVFNVMMDRDLVSLNALVNGYVQNGFVREALSLVEEMKSLGMKPDIVTWNTLIRGFSQENNDVMIQLIFRRMESSGVKPDVISWTTIISGLAQNFRSREALSAFREMLRMRLLPAEATISGLLSASACVADLRRGKEFHGFSVVMGFETSLHVRSALIDMYAKCGLISEAMYLFEGMSERSTVTWNSMIFGFANHGYCHESIEFFCQMLREEVKPDHLTFTAAFTACAHAGMVDVGKSLFQLMQEKHNIKPRSEHYASMVDLLGRAGMVAEAYDFIQGMPTEPDSFVWGALLGACRLHNCLDLAEVAAKHLAKLEPKSSGSSVLLGNLYRDSSKWENAMKVKNMMKKRKLRRFLGCSWIEV